MTADLTTAAGFELESGDAESVNRWTKKGDRLYVNDLDGNFDAGYVDLQTGEMADTDFHIKSTEVTVDGETMTITFEGKCYGDAFEKTVVVAIDWGETDEEDGSDDESDDDREDGMDEMVSQMRSNLLGDEEEDDESDDDEPELVADGGVEVVDDGTTDHIDDSAIRDGIEAKDDPDHPEALTVPEVRDLLAHIQRSTEAYWGEWLDLISSGDATVVAETDDVVVLDVGTHSPYEEELADYDGAATVDEISRLVVSVVHHNVARGVAADHNWDATYPLVIRKPDGVADGEDYVESVMAWLRSEGCSPGQAWHYYGVEIRGNSQSEWARQGHGDRSAISKALDKARQKVSYSTSSSRD